MPKRARTHRRLTERQAHNALLLLRQIAESTDSPPTVLRRFRAWALDIENRCPSTPTNNDAP